MGACTTHPTEQDPLQNVPGVLGLTCKCLITQSTSHKCGCQQLPHASSVSRTSETLVLFRGYARWPSHHGAGTNMQPSRLPGEYDSSVARRVSPSQMPHACSVQSHTLSSTKEGYYLRVRPCAQRPPSLSPPHACASQCQAGLKGKIL